MERPHDKPLKVLQQARRCTTCADALPFDPRPLLAGNAMSRIVIIGQAPGSVAHQSGIPWDDRSGERLRDWLALTKDEFYDPSLVALLPMGFCYPGTGRSGDLAPRPECAPQWHERILDAFVGVRLTVLIGRYAMERYIGKPLGTITEVAKRYEELLPSRIALPHPSGRNNIWLKKNAWFERDALPALQAQVRAIK